MADVDLTLAEIRAALGAAPYLPPDDNPRLCALAYRALSGAVIAKYGNDRWLKAMLIGHVGSRELHAEVMRLQGHAAALMNVPTRELLNA